MPRIKTTQPALGGLQPDAALPLATPKRAKTRPPALVRERELRAKEPLPRGSYSHIQTPAPPVPLAVKAQQAAVPDGLAMLMEHFQSAIRDKNWDKLGDLVEGISDPATGLDLRSLSHHPAVKKTLDNAAIEILMAGTPLSDEQLSLTLDMLDIGADWNARDVNGNSVLNILRKNMDDDLLQFIIEKHPRFQHLFLDREGRPIAPKP